MKLWIFGDSYADADFDRAGIGADMWVKQLENHFKYHWLYVEI